MDSIQTFEADVTHLSSQGFGVVRGPDRVTYFVRGTWRGDRGLFRVTDESEGDYRFAALEALLVPSPDRRPVPCPHLGSDDKACSGCPWMMIAYEAQLREKQHRVQYALARLGLDAAPVEEIWPAPAVFGYRRRAQFKTDGQTIGYAGRQGLSIAPIDACLVLSGPLQSHLQTLQKRLPEPAWQPTGTHIWNYIDLDEDSDMGEVTLNRRRPFQQANAAQNEAMRAWVAGRMRDLDSSQPVLELFSGSGNFTEVLSEAGCSSILALEVGADAVLALTAKNLPRVTAQRLDLYGKGAAIHVSRLAPNTRVLLANPPRAGLGDHWRLARLLPALHTVLLISCDPGSFAQDARRLAQQGFHLLSAQPLDQMPHTPHVEILGWFQRRSSTASQPVSARSVT